MYRSLSMHNSKSCFLKSIYYYDIHISFFSLGVVNFLKYIGKISRYRNLLDNVSSFSGVKDLIVFLIIKMTSFKSFLIYVTSQFDHQIISTNIKQVVISCQFCPPSNRAWSEILSSKIEEPVLPLSTNGSIEAKFCFSMGNFSPPVTDYRSTKPQQDPLT